MWQEIAQLIKNYMGSGLILILYLACLAFLVLREKDKAKRCIFVYMPVIVLVVFLLPPFRMLFEMFGEDEISYRILWLVPMAVTIVYSAVKIMAGEPDDGTGRMAKAKARPALILIAAAILIAACGTFYYSSPYVSIAENEYHVPDVVVEICDQISVEGREVMAVFPDELMPYVRQYTPYVCMPYGRQLQTEWGTTTDDLWEAMKLDTVDATYISQNAMARNCHYIIVDSEKAMIGSFNKNGYVLFGKVGKYNIFVQTDLDLSIN